MKLSFIGMSGVGKSHWAKQLAQAGFIHFDCDAMIANRLGEMIQVAEDEDPVHAVGRWMGMPWSEGYAQREAQYLEFERSVTDHAIDQVAALSPDQHAVIDTTGSVVYAGYELLVKLKQATCVAYFAVPDGVRQQMVELYLREPKPVLWQGGYQPQRDEPREAALARCYGQLLAERTERYSMLADVCLDYHALREPDCDVERLLAMINPG